MAKGRASRLKVFRTPIGFHDAYVAAPSRKAALAAWGAQSDLFAAGAAEPVIDPALSEVPLSRPGEVIKVLRGSRAEQLAALGAAAAARRKPEPRSSPGKRATAAKPKPKPSARALEAAEAAVEALAREQGMALAALDAELRALERRRRDMERQHARALGDARRKAETEQARFQRALAAWRGGA